MVGPGTPQVSTQKSQYGAGTAVTANSVKANNNKPPSKQPFPSNSLSVSQHQNHLRARSQSPHDSLISAKDFSELHRVRSGLSTATDEQDDDDDDDDDEEDSLPASSSKLQPLRGWRGAVQRSWIKNKGLALVLFGQVFGAGMNIGTRMLENLGKTSDAGDDDSKAMGPFQVLFARMTITMILSVFYMWYKKTPDFPLGAKSVRWLLVARGLGGFFGAYGFYSALQYLPIGDALVLTFLAPFLSCYVCARLFHEPFTRADKIGGLLSILGVILIARPTTLFSFTQDTTEPTSGTGVPSQPDPNTSSTANSHYLSAPEATSAQRLFAVGISMVGVIGATIAYVTIRWIGTRAHPLISVNYFATWCTIASATALTLFPGVDFVLPSDFKQWGLLCLIGVGGFVMQFLITAGLRYEKSSRATNMIYTSELFALAADRIIWGQVPSAWSLAGSALILGSAIMVAIQKESAAVKREGDSSLPSSASTTRGGYSAVVSSDEEAGLAEGVETVEMVSNPQIAGQTRRDESR